MSCGFGIANAGCKLQQKVTSSGNFTKQDTGGGPRPMPWTLMFPGDLLRNAMAPVKTLVSKKKRRLVEDGFNLDLSYITDRIIAMGFPANNFEALYRNDADEVVDFLWDRHGDRFFVYNLCRERRYDQSRFAGRLQHVPLRDHHPPPLAAIRPFCEHAHDWLTADDEHVIVVHCKAGKGRTGVMVCSYLLYAGLASSPEQAMELFAQRRTSDGKGITIPSQKRYVDYFYRLLRAERAGRTYWAAPLWMRAVQLYKVDKWPSFLEAELVERTTDGEEYTVACTASTGREENQPAQLTFAQERGVHVTGDVLLVIWGRSRSFMPRERLCHVWFNTWFVADLPRDASGQGTIKWFKKGLDRACRDADLPDLACVQLTFLGPEAGALGQNSRE